MPDMFYNPYFALTECAYYALMFRAGAHYKTVSNDLCENCFL